MWLTLRLLQCLTVPAVALRTLWLWGTGKLSLRDVRDVLRGRQVVGPALWIHAASLGEVRSAKGLIAELAVGGPVLVTVTRKPALTEVDGWGVAGVTAAMAPLDLGALTRRILGRNRIRSLIVLENELWPVRLLTAHRHHVPVALISARMSAGSAKFWARIPQVARAMLGPVALIVPQDAQSAERLVMLGARQEITTDVVKLKAAYQAPKVEIPPEFAAWPRNKVILAAATHAGEDEIVLRAFRELHSDDPDLRLIIAPRHDDRGDAVANLVRAAGFDLRRRSHGEPPDAAVYLADTMGEMALWYRMAGVAFVGGSLVRKGGHTPYEPAAAGCPVLHGPHVANFQEEYADFDARRAAMVVNDASDLVAAIPRCLAEDDMASRIKNFPQVVDIKMLSDQINALSLTGESRRR